MSDEDEQLKDLNDNDEANDPNIDREEAAVDLADLSIEEAAVNQTAESGEQQPTAASVRDREASLVETHQKSFSEDDRAGQELANIQIRKVRQAADLAVNTLEENNGNVDATIEALDRLQQAAAAKRANLPEDRMLIMDEERAKNAKNLILDTK